MDVTREILNLQEAYNQVYAPQYINEEVEIATEYFYEMGLNEYGIDILIEELGVEEFVEWVDEIAEEYTLNEATRLQKKAAKKDRILTGPKGSRPQSTTKAREKSQGGVTMKSSKAPFSTIRARKKATKAAVEKQPETKETPKQERQGIGGRIGAAFNFVKNRAAKDTELLGKSIQTARDVATRRGAEAKAVYDAVRERGKKVEQSPQATRARRKAKVAAGKMAQAAGKTAIKAAGAAGASAGEGVKAHRQGKTGAQIAGRMAGTFVRKMNTEEVEAWVNSLIEEGYDLSEYTWENMTEMYMNLKEETDLFDYVLEHLIAEGYADTNESALVIMANMSEEWKESIVEANKAERMLGLTSRERSRARNLNQYADKPIFYKKTKRGRGDNSDPLLNKAHKGMSAKRQASHKAGRNLRGDTGESGNVVRSRYQANKDHEDGYPSIRRIDT